MPNLEEIKLQINGLKPNEQAEIVNHFLTKNLVTGDLTKNLQAEESIEVETETFCGMEVSKLTLSQKELFNKFTPIQRDEMNQKNIKITSETIEFGDIGKEIFGVDVAVNVIKSLANNTVRKLGSGWRLPRDSSCLDENRLKLYPKDSDYDAMIFQMPGFTDEEKIENFRLLTGMEGRYWTSQVYTDGYIIRKFSKDGWYRHWAIDSERFNKNHVRPVRDLS